MPATPLGLRYPDGAQPADVPLDMSKLAQDTETLIKTLGIPRVATAGQESALGTTVGQMCYRTDLGRHRMRTAGGWVTVLPHVQAGAAPVGNSSTSMQVGNISYGVTFAAAPQVLTSEVITSAGVVIHTHAVSRTTTGFQMRWLSSAAWASAVDLPWVAIGWLV